jgi:hypothetical protein
MLLLMFWAVHAAYTGHIISDTWQLDLGIGHSCVIGTEAACERWFMEGGDGEYTLQYFTLPVTVTSISVHAWKSTGGGFEVYLSGCTGAPTLDPYVDWWESVFTATWSTCDVRGETYLSWRNNTGASHINVEVSEIEYQSDYHPIGGWPTCDTVSNADFDTSSSWTLGGTASMTGSVLELPATGDYAQQDFLIISDRYTVTIVAQRTSTGTNDGLVVAMVPTAETGHIAATDPIAIPNDGEFHEETVTLSPDTTGDGVLMISSNGSHQVDYICVEAGYGQNTCTSENLVFDFEDGYNVDDPIFGWGYSQHWRAVEYPLGGYSGGRAQWAYGLAHGGHFGSVSMFAVKQEATIQYDYMVVPSAITVTAYGAALAADDRYVQILTSPDGQNWSIAAQKIYDPGDVVTFTLDYVAPVYLIVASLDDIGISIPMNMAGIQQVEMDACYQGPNTFSECIVGDPDLDISNGYPSHFYWDGAYVSVLGAAALQQDAFIAQSLTPPWAGRYQLAVTSGSTNDPPCSYRVQFTPYGSAVSVVDVPIQCGLGTDHVYTIPVELPAQALTLWIEQTSGESSISRVCLTPGGGPGECLNTNPDMVGGIGYTGDWSYSPGSGRVIIPADGKLAAMGVQYARANPPYQLELILSPAYTGTQADTVINHGSLPGIDATADATHTITATSYLTYALYSDISGGFGPTVWNLGDGDVSVMRYCLKAATGVITNPYPDPFICAAIINPDFVNGTTGWENSNVIVVNGIASFAPDGYLSQSLGDLSDEPITTTIRWLVNAYAPTSATLEVASDYTPTIVSHNVTPGQPRFWEDSAVVSGTTVITISTIISGFELDFVCLYPGGACVGCIPPPLPPGTEPGTVVIPPGGELAECIAPPMGLLPGNITDTLATVWPWGGSPTNFEVMMAYNTGWVRFIGCRLDGYVTWMQDEFWGESWRFGLGGDGLHAHLDNIIFLLATLNILGSLQALLALLQMIGGLISGIVEGIIDAGRALFYLFGILGLALAALLGLLILLAGIIAIIWLVPQEFWVSFRNAVTGSSAVALPLPTSPADPLYNILIGIQLVNQVAGATFIFPIVVVAIVVGSIGLIVWTIKQFSIQLV